MVKALGLQKCCLHKAGMLINAGSTHMVMRQSSGTEVLDTLLDGGFETDTISILYGPGGTGKTNVCLHAALQAIKANKKVIYVDTEGGFSIERFRQMNNGSDNGIENIIFLKPTSFSDQKKAFEELKEMMSSNIGIIIVDSIAMLYRLEIGKTERVYDLNRELGRQIALLVHITRKKNIPVILTNQVYSAMDGTDKTVMVGGDLLKYQSKCIIELDRNQAGIRFARLVKHRSLPENRIVEFEIKNQGLLPIVKKEISE